MFGSVKRECYVWSVHGCTCSCHLLVHLS